MENYLHTPNAPSRTPTGAFAVSRPCAVGEIEKPPKTLRTAAATAVKLRRPVQGVVMARVTITVDDDGVFVDASCDDNEDLTLTEALGIIELAKHTLIRQGMGE